MNVEWIWSLWIQRERERERAVALYSLWQVKLIISFFSCETLFILACASIYCICNVPQPTLDIWCLVTMTTKTQLRINCIVFQSDPIPFLIHLDGLLKVASKMPPWKTRYYGLFIPKRTDIESKHLYSPKRKRVRPKTRPLKLFNFDGLIQWVFEWGKLIFGHTLDLIL